MRKVCPNFDREDGLDTVLEVPVPEEMFTPNNNGRWQSMKTWIRPQPERSTLPPSVLGRNTELQLLLGVIGAPLIPLPVPASHSLNRDIKDHPIESSMAKYIVQQYIASTGGDNALNSIDSIGDAKSIGGKAKRTRRHGSGDGEDGHVGGFILWQKRPDLWSLELLVSGCKISAGSDGKVAWRQTPWHQSHASRGPPRPLRRSLQGLDPRSTANLFSNAVCMGEKVINNEDCFLLKLEAEPSTLRARSSNNVEIIRHTVWGCFSQKTGLLVQFEDTHLLRIKASGDESIYWETTMESLIEDYRPVDGINIAHSGRTSVSLFRFGDSSETHTRTRMEETWMIEEVDFNIWGLSMDCFLPPGDLKKEQEGCSVMAQNKRLPLVPQVPLRIATSKVVAVNMEDSDSIEDAEQGL
ncbi:putative replication factor C subunit 2 [Cinnamomum micranthum f. kanehirae]|uniref:Putative replication factor C subunit 2 n=1 Tax=Cinnamomum micranthum f. kanehirae TaxID=337451 RepID=A0A443NSU2_9MAGN|nr:putative replication factor C subunit 2 [Cinnamomum micranthum f. kanehirae]